MAGLLTGDDAWINQGATEPKCGFVRPPLPIPPRRLYILEAVREGGYGDKWASE